MTSNTVSSEVSTEAISAESKEYIEKPQITPDCKHNKNENPWNNEFCIPDEILLHNPTTNDLETSEHQNTRLELQHLYQIFRSFLYYGTWQFHHLQKKHFNWLALSPKYQHLTKEMPQKLLQIRRRIICNQSFIRLVVDQSQAFLRTIGMPDFLIIDNKSPVQDLNMSKVRSTLKQLAREWSIVGKYEREQCFSPILNKLEELFPAQNSNNIHCRARHKIRILNPGCGLARLPWEIAKLGFKCQGNEFSFHMLLCAHFILNRCRDANMFSIYPYIHISTNVIKFEDQMFMCEIPDVSPLDLMKVCKRNDLISMAAGDFSQIYGSLEQKSQFECLVLCFFIDTAHNILEYLDIFSHVLCVDGYLINFGPLMYHFEDTDEPSIELTHEEIIDLLPDFGFQLIEERRDIQCPYTNNSLSMQKMSYNCVFWVAQKIKDIPRMSSVDAVIEEVSVALDDNLMCNNTLSMNINLQSGRNEGN